MLEGLATRFAAANRQRKLSFVRGLIQQHRIRTVLIVGVYPVTTNGVNQVELGIVDLCPMTIATGIQVATSHDWPAYVAADACELPFADRSFDLVFSNAVIEHVGDETQQRAFVAEHDRIGRAWVLTTPNRWFPVEAHSRTLLRHWSSSWTLPGVTRLLGPRDLRDLVPVDTRITADPVRATLTAYRGPTA